MKRFPNNILAIIFLLLAGLPAGFSIYFLSRQAIIKHRMKEELLTQQVHTLVLDRKDIHWLEQGKEILLNDHLFDVEKITVLGNGKLELKGLYDVEEDELYNELRHALHNEKTEKANTIFPVIFHQLCFESSGLEAHHLKHLFASVITHTDSYSDFFPLVYSDNHFPPPKL